MAIMTLGQFPRTTEYIMASVRMFWTEQPAYEGQCSLIFKDVAIDHEKHSNVVRAGLAKFSKLDEGGANLVYDTMHESFPQDFYLVEYGAGFAVTSRARDFNRDMDLLKDGTLALRQAREVTIDSIAADIFNRGFTTDVYTDRDGNAPFSTAHVYVRPGVGTGSNRVATGTDISDAAIESMITIAKNMKTEEGFPMNVMPKFGVIPVGQEFNWTRAVKSLQIPGSANNDVNALREQGYLQTKPVEWKLLSTKAWFIINQGYSNNGFVMYKHSKDSKDPVVHLDEVTGNTFVRMTMYRSAGLINWRAVVANPGEPVIV